MVATNTMHMEGESASVFHSGLPIPEKLDRARMELLDLSARNRLLNMPRSSKSVRSIDVVDEKSAEIFRILVRENKVFSFVAAKSARPDDEETDAEEVTDLAQPEDNIDVERGTFSRHTDTRLQTRLTPKGLQKRLLELYFDARTLEEEQGVNILYLTLGTLKWVDPTNAENNRFAPLVLIPVSLERGNAGEKFKLRSRPEDFASNLSLEAYLDRVHGIRLPIFEASDAFEPVAYMEGVAEAVAAKSGWSVQFDDVTIGFFSFAKLLMYRDLDPETWPSHAKISDRPLIRGLLADGFNGSDGMIPEDSKIDAFIPPSDMLHIVDSDSSQALAVHEVKRGRDIVIQGPPGTGKSQTIANIIASAIADGKTVLFVAEKMAALEVVKRRLDANGVGAACLELHSNKANKRSLLEELRRTWELGAPKTPDVGSLNVRLTEARDGLNAHASRMHRPHPESGLTPYQVIGHLVRLRSAGERPNDIALEKPAEWTAEGFDRRHAVLSELVERIGVIGQPSEHVWRGTGLVAVTPMEAERLTARFAALAERLAEIEATQVALSSTLECEKAPSLKEFLPVLVLARRVAAAPAMTDVALASAAWNDEAEKIRSVLANGRRFAALRGELADAFVEAAWTSEVQAHRETLADLPASFSLASFGHLAFLAQKLPALMAEGQSLAKIMRCAAPVTVGDIQQLVRIGERVSAAPNMDVEAFRSDLWNHSVGRASDLADAVGAFEQAQQEIGSALTEAAWKMDLSAARMVLASHGEGFLRIVNGEWRRANRLVRSVLTKPDQSLADTLKQLDALARGQSAKRKIESEDAFGRDVFASDWRGDRSSSASLIALVDWMQSLMGLGAEPRLAAAARPDRREVAFRLERTEKLLTGLLPAMTQLWDDVSGSERMFAGATSIHEVALKPLLDAAASFHAADCATAELSTVVPVLLAERLSRLDKLVEGQRRADVLMAADALARSAFDGAWNGRDSNWEALEQASAWVVANSDIRLLASRIGDRATLAGRADAIEKSQSALISDLERILAELRFDLSQGFGVADLHSIAVERLRSRLAQWSTSGEQLFQWVAYRDRAEEGGRLGCRDVVRRLEDGRLRPHEVIPAFEMAYYEAIHADMIDRDPELGRFDGTLHGKLVREFCDLDRQRISIASVEVVQAHHKRIPSRDGGGVGSLGVLRAEMQKKRAHMPIRRLMERAGPAIQALKPVFMMSPLSVAQFLVPGAFDFDLLVMDEASQIQPVDAIGAIARARQVVVVGDPKQLPPTAFFSKMTGNAREGDEDEGSQVGDIESILGLFTARGMPTRMLRWHYRSRHQSLIAVSNRQFYESKLFIVPSPYTAEAGLGLRFHHIAEGLFDAGGTRTNAIEAKIVAEAIVDHACRYPTLSLGVATFSAAQRRAILDHLELLRRALPPEVEAFFQDHPAEPFFVKNLENVQGDERDVIFISVGYGPTMPGGRVPMRFGPLGSEGGERRLNVLISRAKQRCEVFASMTDEDIEPDFAATRKGVFAFRLFLQFARTGRLVMAESTGRGHDSVFEEQVAKALQARGYQVHRQVGLAGFYIDLAVVDADRPGRYMLGIECDGAAYHDARSARDRDRLRQSVLESHGWTIHRVWSTDWFQRPAEQLDIIVARIEAAKAEYGAEATPLPGRPKPLGIVTIEREDTTEIGIGITSDAAPSIDFYVEASLTRPGHLTDELHEAPTGILTSLVEETVRIEGPVHVDEVIDRIRSAWGLKRAGGRIQQAVHAAVEVAVSTGRVARSADFLSIPDAAIRVRDRSAVSSQALRRAEMLPPSEIRLAILNVVGNNFGATAGQVVQATSRMFGIKATSAPVRSAIESQIAEAVSLGLLTEQAGVLMQVKAGG